MKTIQNKNHFLVFMLILAVIMALSIMDTSNAVSDVYVDVAGDDTNPGTELQPYKTINYGISQVDNAGTVHIGAGTFNTNVDDTHKDYNITVDKNVTLQGAGKDQTIIDPETNERAFYVNSGCNLTLKDLKIQNGTNVLGGAIYSEGTVNIENCVFENNHGTVNGGAICNWQGTVNIADSEFNSNYAGSGTYGGAIFNVNGYLTITNTKFNGNHADIAGGAIYDGFGSSSTTNISGCEFTSNYAGQDGGAIYNSGTLTLSSSTFSQNKAETTGINAGGGAITNIGTLNVDGCIFDQNKAKTDTNAAGGAIASGGGQTLTITNSVFTQNSAEGFNADGGAIAFFTGTLYANYNRFYENTAILGTAIYKTYGNIADIRYNWWGSNNPDFDTLLYNLNGPNQNYNPWLYMTITANPTTIHTGESSLITVSFNNLFDGTTVTPLDPATGHIPDGTPVTFNTDLGSIGCKTIDKETSCGIATATLTADETPGTAHVNGVTDAQTVNVDVTIDAKSSLYLTVTPSKINPVVGDTVIYTLKVGNKGPDTAKDVVMTYVVPDGLEFAGAKVDVGTWTYDEATRTITWTIGDVPVGDPYMWLSLRIVRAGSYIINPRLSTSIYDPTLNTDTQSLTVNAASASTAHAATVNMQNTGMPVQYLVLAILMVIGGILVPKRK